MELFELLIGFGLGVVSTFLIKKLSFFIQLLLCLATSFTFIKIFHPDIILRPVFEWSFYNLATGYNFWGLGIIGFLLSGAFFYFLIPLILERVLINKIENKINPFFYSLTKIELKGIKEVSHKFIKSWLKIQLKITPFKNRLLKNIADNKKDVMIYGEYIDSIILSVSISTHIVVAWFTFFSFNLYFIIPCTVIILALSAILFLLPVSKIFISDFYKFSVDELNRDQHQVSK